jgi:DNA-binding NarL/FixJ family response regulator
MDMMLDSLTDGLNGPDASDNEARSSATGGQRALQRGTRIEHRVALIAGARFVPARPGSTPVIVIDDSDAAEDGAPVWLAVASGSDQLEALQLGAAGIVEPTASGEALLAAVEAAKLGHAVLPAGLLRSLLPPGDVPLIERQAHPNGPALTPRENAVLQLLSEGATNKMIARALEISVHTAKFHVASILEKLDAVTRTDAVAQGIRQGLLML